MSSALFIVLLVIIWEVIIELFIHFECRDLPNIILVDIPGFGMPMLAMYAPQTQSFDPTNWYVLIHLLVVRDVYLFSMQVDL